LVQIIAETLHAAQGHPTLVSLGTFEELTNPMPKQEYAGGWIITKRPWADGLALTHAGSNTTWYCVVWLAPHKDFAVLIATNYFAESVAEAAEKGIALLIESVKPDAKHDRSSIAPVPADGTGGSF